MAQKRRTRKVILIEEFARKIKSGQLISGSEFPSLDELMRTCDVGSRTAGAIVRALSQMGLLDTQRGRRSLVHSEFKVPLRPRFDKPVGIVAPPAPIFKYVAWRDWLAEHLQERLLKDGFRSLIVPADFKTAYLTENVSAIIVIGETLCDQKWEEINASGLPRVALSFARPMPDTVYVDYRNALDELAIYLARRNCRRFIHISSFEREARTVFNWYAKIGFMPLVQAYGIDATGCHHPVLLPEAESCETMLKQLVIGNRDKPVIVLSNTSYHALIVEIMKRYKRKLGVHYELVSLSHVPLEKAPGICVDQNSVEIADNLLSMLYMRQIMKQPQFGKIIMAKFHAQAL